jgi:hypothetical protein
MLSQKSVEEIQIENISNKRQELYHKYQDSYDEEKRDYMIKWPEEIDRMADEIVGYIKNWKKSLPVEFILEELTKLGQAPCLLYDDEGHWAVSGEGMQDVAIGDPIDMNMIHFIEKHMWKPTIREAIYYYLDYEEEDDK